MQNATPAVGRTLGQKCSPRDRYTVQRRAKLNAEAASLHTARDTIAADIKAVQDENTRTGTGTCIKCQGPTERSVVLDFWNARRNVHWHCPACAKAAADAMPTSALYIEWEQMQQHDQTIRQEAQNRRTAREDARQAWARAAGLDAAGATLGTFVVNFDPASLRDNDLPDGMTYEQAVAHRRAALDAVGTYPDPNPFMLIAGPAGRGKTHLVAARLRREARPCKRNNYTPTFIPINSEASLYHRWRSQPKWAVNGEEHHDIITAMADAPCLVIDGLGDTEPTKAWRDVMVYVIGERFAGHRQTIITTQLTPPEITKRYGEAVARRLADRTRCTLCYVPGPRLSKVF